MSERLISFIFVNSIHYNHHSLCYGCAYYMLINGDS